MFVKCLLMLGALQVEISTMGRAAYEVLLEWEGFPL